MKIRYLAEYLHDCGFNVFPVIVTEGKKKFPYLPLGTGDPYLWQHLRRGRLDKERFLQAYDNAIVEGKTVYLGILPGLIIEGKYKDFCFWAIDIDDPSNTAILDITSEKCKENGVWFEKSLRKGYHLYGITKDTAKYEKNINLGIELFSENNYFIAVYGNFEGELYDIKPMAINEVYQGFKEKIAEYKKIPINKKPTLPELKKGVKYPGRNNSAFKIAIDYRDKGLSIEETTKLMLIWNKNNRPPLHEGELLTCIKSAYKKEKQAQETPNKDIPTIDEKAIEQQEEDHNTEEYYKDISETGFIGFYLDYQDLRTNAPKQYGIHFCIQLMGLFSGRKTINEIQPNSVNHNTYICPIGESGVSRKTTSQDIARSIGSCYQDYILPDTYSPEGLLRTLSTQPRGILYGGEFSTLLRGIKGNNYLASFKEISNELHRSPEIYKKTLSKSKDSFIIEAPYFCQSATCTPVQFFSNIGEEEVYGGFLPRWILIPGKAKYRPRQRLPANTEDYAYCIRRTLLHIDTLFNSDTTVKFILDDNALQRFNEIDQELQENKKWNRIQPFVTRYTEYIIAYADMLFLSDLIDALGYTKFIEIKSLVYLDNLDNLINLDNLVIPLNTIDTDKEKNPNSLELFKQTKVTKLSKLSKFSFSEDKKTLFFSISKDYINRAWQLLAPCLKFSQDVAIYVSEDLKIAKLLSVLTRFSPVLRSRAMTNSGLQKKDFNDCIETLMERERAFQMEFLSENTRKKQPKIVYCLKEFIDSDKCLKCCFKETCYQEELNV